MATLSERIAALEARVKDLEGSRAALELAWQDGEASGYERGRESVLGRSRERDTNSAPRRRHLSVAR